MQQWAVEAAARHPNPEKVAFAADMSLNESNARQAMLIIPVLAYVRYVS